MHYTFLVDVDRPEDVVRTFGEDKRGATEALKKFEGPYLRYLWNDMWYSDDLNFRGVYLAEKDGQKAKWGLQIEVRDFLDSRESYQSVLITALNYSRQREITMRLNSSTSPRP